MPLSLSQFRANVTDFARPNRFWVEVGDAQNDIALFGNDNSDALKRPAWNEGHGFLARSTQLPGRSIGNIAVPWNGQTYNIAGDQTFDDITITFHNNYEWDIRAFFEGWLQSIAQMDTNERSQPGAYKSDVVTMHQLGRTEADVLKSYQLIGAYPINLAPIDLSMDNTDQISEFSVTFKYDYYTIL